MRISIVTVSYNQARFIRKAIESVLSQKIPDLEYVVLDGGSEDGSVDIISEYECELAYWRSWPDAGQAAAIDEGFRITSGDILGWLNSDDMLVPGALEFVLKCFENNSAIRFLYGGCEVIDADDQLIRRLIEPCYNTNWQLYIRNCVNQPSAFWRRDLYFDVGAIDRSLQYAMDYDLWFKFCSKTKPYITRKILSRERVHPEAKSQSGSVLLEREMENVRARYFKPATLRKAPIKRLAWRVERVMKKGLAGCYSPLNRIGSRLDTT